MDGMRHTRKRLTGINARYYLLVPHRASVVLIAVDDVSRSVCYSVSGGYFEMILMITDIIKQYCSWVICNHKRRQGQIAPQCTLKCTYYFFLPLTI